MKACWRRKISQQLHLFFLEYSVLVAWQLFTVSFSSWLCTPAHPFTYVPIFLSIVCGVSEIFNWSTGSIVPTSLLSATVHLPASSHHLCLLCLTYCRASRCSPSSIFLRPSSCPCLPCLVLQPRSCPCQPTCPIGHVVSHRAMTS